MKLANKGLKKENNILKELNTPNFYRSFYIKKKLF
jgi:hypothetical protein